MTSAAPWNVVGMVLAAALALATAGERAKQ